MITEFEIEFHLRKRFDMEWKKLTDQNSKADFVINFFDIKSITESINDRIQSSSHQETSRRYNFVVLNRLTHEFSMILFYNSERGKVINKQVVIESQIDLKLKGKCSIHPCDKIFN